MWQSAVATILMRTSPSPGGATITVHTSSGFFASQAMAALHSMGLPAVSDWAMMPGQRCRWRVRVVMGAGRAGLRQTARGSVASML